MDSQEKFLKIIWAIFDHDGYDARYKARLEMEVKEIDILMAQDYFLDLFDRKAKFAKNENNLFVAKLLRLVDDFDIELEPQYTLGEFPDVDTDYLQIVRDYLKNEWAIEEFGKDNVCAIGNYT